MYRLTIALLLLANAVVLPAQLRLHPQNNQYFLYKNKPTVLVGSGEHYGAVMNLDFDYRKYLHTLAKDGLNVTRLFTGPYREAPGAFGIDKNTLGVSAARYSCAWARSTTPGYADGGYKFDLTRWDEGYFSRLKDFLHCADSLDILVEITLFTSFYGDMWQISPFHPQNNINGTPDMPYQRIQTPGNGSYQQYQEDYVRKMTRELNAFDNIYFEIQNEPWSDNGQKTGIWNDYVQPGMLKSAGDHWRCVQEPASQAALDWQRSIAAVIRDEERLLPKKHLIAQNIGNFIVSAPETGLEKIDILTFHYALPQIVAHNAWHGKLAGFNETGFAGSDDATYRRQAWRFMFAGGGLFNHLDYSFSVGLEDGSDTTYQAPGGGSPALRAQLGVLRKCLESLDLPRLRPDATVVRGSSAFYSALSDGKSQWAIYYEAAQPFSLALTLPVGKYEAYWHDAVTGRLLLHESFEAKSGRSTLINQAEGIQEGWVRIQKVAK
jgi:Cellulase (glycosyl hydrolase family 5)